MYLKIHRAPRLSLGYGLLIPPQTHDEAAGSGVPPYLQRNSSKPDLSAARELQCHFHGRDFVARSFSIATPSLSPSARLEAEVGRDSPLPVSVPQDTSFVSFSTTQPAEQHPALHCIFNKVETVLLPPSGSPALSSLNSENSR